MKTINEEIRRIREIMNLGESIQHNNFHQMGISRKTISRGGEPHRGTYEEQNAAPELKLQTPRDIEILGKIEINKEKEESRQKDITDIEKEKESEEIEGKREDLSKQQEEREEELELEKEEIKKKEELEARLATQRERTT
tara:strand:+ start:141 stop:560 length:420 start_codon:yes stop_codon:yes gene_type:complete